MSSISSKLKHIDAIFLVSTWWGFFLLLSLHLDLEERIFLNPQAVFYILNFILFLFFGGQLYQRLSSKKIWAAQDKLEHPNFPPLIFNSFIIINACFLMINIYLVSKSFELYAHGTSTAKIRASFFSISETGNYWFSNKVYWTLYLITSAIYFNLIMFLAIPIKVFFNKNTLLYILILYLVLDSLTKGGRGGAYSLIVVLFLCYWIKIAFFYEPGGRIDLKLKLIIVFIIAIIIGTTALRGSTNIINEITDYHTYGFHLFSTMIEDSYNYEQALGYGRNFLGGIDYYFHYFIRVFFNEDYISPFMSNGTISDDFLIVGYDTSLVNSMETLYSFRTANDFFTILSSGYSDFGGLGIILTGLVSGFTLKYSEINMIRSNSFLDIIFYLYLTYTLLMGIFSSAFETPVFWVIIMLYLFVKNNSSV